MTQTEMVKDGTRKDAFKKPVMSVGLRLLLLSSQSMGITYSNTHIYLLFQQLPGSYTCKHLNFLLAQRRDL